MKPRQEVDVLQDVLRFIKEKPRRNRGVVVSTYLNDEMWRKYRKRMMELGLIREVEDEKGKKVLDITPKGDDLLNLIGVFKSAWHSFPPKSGWEKEPYKPWQEAVMRYVWDKGKEGFTAKGAWECTLEVDKISRPQVLKFLDRMVELGILNNNPRSGLGGRSGFFTLSVLKVDFASFMIYVRPRMLRFSGKSIKIKDSYI